MVKKQSTEQLRRSARLKPQTSEIRARDMVKKRSTEQSRRSARRKPQITEIRRARDSRHRETLNSLPIFFQGLPTELLPPQIEEDYIGQRTRTSRLRGRDSLEDLPWMISGICSDDRNLKLSATTQLMKLLSADDFLELDEATLSKVVPPLINFLDNGDPQLQYKAARVLKNITFGTSKSSRVVTECGAVPMLVKLLSSSCNKVCEQAAWTLGNIAGHSSAFRDLVVMHEAVPPLLALFNNDNELSLRRIVAWTLTNLCRGDPEPPFEKFGDAVARLIKVVGNDDRDVVKETFWALYYLSRGTYGGYILGFPIDALIKAVYLLRLHSGLIIYPAILTLVSLVSRSEDFHRFALVLGAPTEVAVILQRKGFKDTLIYKQAVHLSQLLRRPIEQPGFFSGAVFYLRDVEERRLLLKAAGSEEEEQTSVLGPCWVKMSW